MIRRVWRWLSVWWMPLDSAALVDQSRWTVARGRSVDVKQPQVLVAGPWRWSRRAMGVALTRTGTFGAGRRVFVVVLPVWLSKRSKWVPDAE